MAPNSSDQGSKNAKKEDNLASLLRAMGSPGDCDRPACDDTKSALAAALQRVGRSGSRVGTQGGGASSESTEQQKEQEQHVVDGIENSQEACPPTRDEIGLSTWSLLHSTAAWYPNQPSIGEMQLMSNFMTALARFYPCSWCAKDFQENVKLSPPRTETREDLCLWLCEQHNIVNEKLGKPLFHCTMRKLDERWRKSSNPGCQQ